MTRLWVLFGLLLVGTAAAQDRPSEEDLFGAPAAAEPTKADEPPAPEAPANESRVGEKLARTRDTLDLGGQLYLRSFLFTRKGAPPSQWDATSPSLLDVYLDARPSDRVRAFVLGRMQYDPTVQSTQQTTAVVSLPAGAADPSQPLPLPGAASRKQTEVLLDQLWLRFDLSRKVFLTAGKQHVKWGVGRFWNPTDFLHVTRRDPLATFDARTGTTMLRVQIPWEQRGWSFQTAAILEPLTPTQDAAAPAAGTLGAIGGAARAELVLGGAELGIGGVVQKGRPSRLGVDLSAGLLDLDLYGELALRSAPETPLYAAVPGASASLPVTARFALREGAAANPAATLGASWTTKYGRDDDTLTLGAEYFYERNGYSDAHIYPLLLLQGAFTPFYLGRHYAGAFLFLPSPGSWDAASFTASTLANVSDGSWLGRVDFALTLLTYLRFEAFGAVHGGTEGGEFRLALDVPPQDLGNGTTTPRVRVAAPLLDVGVALRVAL